MARGVRGAAAVVAALLCVAGGVGWLYLLRHSGALRGGPRLADALPLQRLAGGADQPVGRVAAVWLLAGLAGGVLLSAIGFGRRPSRAALMLAVALVVLLALGAASDAVTASEALRAHLSAQPHRSATWIAAALAGLGAALPAGGRPA